MITATVVLAPLREGAADAARAAIRALREPFARVPGTHLARVQVLDDDLLLAADHDGPIEEWLPAAARELDAVLRCCASWPGADDAAAAVRWVRARKQVVGFSIVGSPEATVEQVGEALALRDSLMRFAAETEGLDDAALHAAWGRR
jgi:alkanesulfonate monooxygenase SsuD/methylene tetrahydromethanopterin reductase-like flavin-dependent oxidoreductase (luciferase family)